MIKLKIEKVNGEIVYLEGQEAVDYIKPLPLSWLVIDAMFTDIPFETTDGEILTAIEE